MSNTLTDTTRPFTRDERDLVAAVRRHLRADGWKLYPGEAEHRGAHLAADWTYAWNTDNKNGRVLRVRLLTPHGSTQQVVAEVDVDSVREAVDVGAAIGLLPQGMSSQYRAGRESAPSWTAPLTLAADQVDPGWQLLDASTEASWHLVTEVRDCVDKHAEWEDTGCTILVSTAYSAGEAHMPSDTTVDVRIPAGEL